MNKKQKLTNEQVAWIRSNEDRMRQTEMAERLNVSQAQISNIVRGKQRRMSKPFKTVFAE